MKKFLTILFAMAAVALFCCASPVKSVNSSKPERVSKVVKYATSMHCKNCEKKVIENVSFEKGVLGLQTDMSDRSVTITFNPAKTDTLKLARAIRSLGYSAKVVYYK